MGKVRRNAGKEYDLIGMHLCVWGSVECPGLHSTHLALPISKYHNNHIRIRNPEPCLHSIYLSLRFQTLS